VHDIGSGIEGTVVRLVEPVVSLAPDRYVEPAPKSNEPTAALSLTWNAAARTGFGGSEPLARNGSVQQQYRQRNQQTETAENRDRDKRVDIRNGLVRGAGEDSGDSCVHVALHGGIHPNSHGDDETSRLFPRRFVASEKWLHRNPDRRAHRQPVGAARTARRIERAGPDDFRLKPNRQSRHCKALLRRLAMTELAIPI
jgi:hypothetical protein